MSFEFIASAKSTAGSTTATKDTSDSLTILSGDLVVAYAGYTNAHASSHAFNDDEDTAFTVEDYIEYNDWYVMVCGWHVYTAPNTSVITVTLGDSKANLELMALQFRNTGYTISKDQDQASGNDWGTAPATGDINTAEASALAVSGLWQAPDDVFTMPPNNPLIDGGAATLIENNDALCAFYRIIAVSNGNAAATLDDGVPWCITLNSFKGTEAGGGSEGGGSHYYRQLMRKKYEEFIGKRKRNWRLNPMGIWLLA